MCARKGWLEYRYRAYLFKPLTDPCKSAETEEEQHEQSEAAETDEDELEARNNKKKEHRVQRLLRDRDGKSQQGSLRRIWLYAAASLFPLADLNGAGLC